MQYLELKEALSNYIVFSSQDIKKIDSTFYRSRLNDWQKKGYLKKIRRGFYIFSDQKLNESTLFLIANKIYPPSYISFEMALSFYNLIPESVYGITSSASGKTKKFTSEIGEFIYHHLKPELIFGYTLVSVGTCVFKIAEAEKAILDFLYINQRFKTEQDFSELRINQEEFRIKIDLKKFANYLAEFKNKSLENRAKKLLKYINHANA